MNLSFRGKPAKALFSTYINHNICIQIVDAQTDQHMAIATVNTEVMMPDDIVNIKNYSENTGVDIELIRAGIIEDEPINYIRSGHVTIPQYLLTDKAKECLF